MMIYPGRSRTLMAGLFLISGLFSIQALSNTIVQKRALDFERRFKAVVARNRLAADSAFLAGKLHFLEEMHEIDCFRLSETGPGGGPMALAMSSSPCAAADKNNSQIFEVSGYKNKVWKIGTEVHESGELVIVAWLLRGTWIASVAFFLFRLGSFQT